MSQDRRGAWLREAALAASAAESGKVDAQRAADAAMRKSSADGTAARIAADVAVAASGGRPPRRGSPAACPRPALPKGAGGHGVARDVVAEPLAQARRIESKVIARPRPRGYARGLPRRLVARARAGARVARGRELSAYAPAVRPEQDAVPSQVWGLRSQHQPSFGRP